MLNLKTKFFSPHKSRSKILPIHGAQLKSELRKLGVKYDFKGDFLKRVTDQQLEGLGLHSILERFSKDATFAASLLNEGENEYDCERYDLLRHGHLPKMDRTHAQVKLGVSESSQLEHMAARLVYIDVHDQKDVPDRFHYIGQSWLYMYRIRIALKTTLKMSTLIFWADILITTC